MTEAITLTNATYGIRVTAESAANYIDITTVNAGCDEIDEAAEDFTRAGEVVNSAASNLDAQVLQIDGATLQPTIESYGDAILGVKQSITEITDSIRASAIDAYNRLQVQLNNIAQDEFNQAVAKAKEKETSQ